MKEEVIVELLCCHLFASIQVYPDDAFFFLLKTHSGKGGIDFRKHLHLHKSQEPTELRNDTTGNELCSKSLVAIKPHHSVIGHKADLYCTCSSV